LVEEAETPRAPSLTNAQRERLNPYPYDDSTVVKVELHRAGEKCKHWTRGPDGKPTYGSPLLCNLCHGSGVLEVDIRLRFHKKKGMLHTYFPGELPHPEFLPKSVRTRPPPAWYPKVSIAGGTEFGPPPEFLQRRPPRRVA
jgi:hypothetical protein